ncbi:translation initiation factor IF-2 [Spiroplasma sabaudiense Ar-1343]|uniref:Translation initiation factor IF-2 n=1 Tax=Spiroplasma sabaudiense Ar-1343 TaxID=1276257 RepID=W6AAU4_9MOLU|nr:translation initiation factor IF-2 [Spiroplasma sabaudiense]AHI53975.1 translation initiation factor IF-2 [Spiroplasma sabaudiense Ar-1343]
MGKKVNQNKNNKNSNPKQNSDKNKLKAHSNTLKNQLRETKATGLIDGVFIFTGPITIAEFGKKINKNVAEIVKYFFKSGAMVTPNTSLSEEQIGELALEFGFDFKKEVEVTKENIFETLLVKDKPSDLKERPPVVTIMGHVDHGKTTLLDSIRNTNINVTDGEFGGITQHIGAYQVKTDKNQKITFIDTPGHEAFTEMRARGADVTDIVILVVAADDGVMPQTEEAIDHAKAANVPIIVFVNKIDKPGADSNRVKTELMRFNIVAEEFGGDVPFIEGSAKQRQGLENLLETILLVSELKELKANPDKFATGTVIEAHLSKSRGPTATVLVQQGTLNMRDLIVAGATYGLTKDMENEHGAKIKSALPSQPVVLVGLNEVPRAGDKFMIVSEEKMARDIAEAQLQRQIEESRNKHQSFTLDSIKNQIDQGNLKTVNVILKADTQGSVEAVRNSLQKIEISGVRLDIIRASVGAISNSDITLALASSAIVYGFNVRPTAPVRQKADEDGVEIRLHTIIYKLIEELEEAAKGMLDPIFEEKVLGQAEVRQIFRHSQVGTIAGCHVIDGVIPRGSKLRILRDGIIIFTGELSSLKHVKEEIKEAKKDQDCGLTVKNFNDIKENDIIEVYKVEEVK